MLHLAEEVKITRTWERMPSAIGAGLADRLSQLSGAIWLGKHADRRNAVFDGFGISCSEDPSILVDIVARLLGLALERHQVRAQNQKEH